MTDPTEHEARAKLEALRPQAIATLRELANSDDLKVGREARERLRERGIPLDPEGDE